ncbi:MAG: ATP-binding protein [Candidatus Cloacimonadaceae bacterium]|nr:ATP-binding protein [Candidatus Cloacimonadaceae bacterium]
MKQGKLIRISNVEKADETIRFLLNRPKLEMVGLGLIYGKPGLGKTTYANRIAFSKGYIYLRLEATTTPKSFAVHLLTALYKRFNLGEYIPMGTANNLFKACLQILEDHEDTVIVIDEIDYAFRHEQLLGAIRDIVDETLTVVILVGMQNAKDRLAQINEYYFDRCNSFYEFQPVTKADIKAIATQILDVEVGREMIEIVYHNCAGNLRKAMKLMHMLETAIQKQPNIPLHDIDFRKAL